jgi:hypothetical protein
VIRSNWNGSRAKASRCRGRFPRAVTPRNDRQ